MKPFFIFGILGSSMSILGAAPVLLDDFNWNVVTTGHHTFLSGAVPGGELDLYVATKLIGKVSISDGKLRVDSDVQPESIGLTYDGVDGSSNKAFGLNLDVTGGGTNDRLRIDFSSVTGHISYIFAFADSLGNELVSISHDVTKPGVAEYRFDRMSVHGSGVNLTAVKQVRFSFHNIHIGDAFMIDSIKFVGEGSAAATKDPNLIARQRLTRAIKALQKKVRSAQKRGQKAKARMLLRNLRKLKIQLRKF